METMEPTRRIERLTSTSPEEPGPSALLLDFDMRDPIVWGHLIDRFNGLGYAVTYRRWFPHVTADDVATDNGQSRYHWIVVAAGSAPGRPGESMRPAAVDHLLEHTLSGGGLLLLPRHGLLLP